MGQIPHNSDDFGAIHELDFVESFQLLFTFDFEIVLGGLEQGRIRVAQNQKNVVRIQTHVKNRPFQAGNGNFETQFFSAQFQQANVIRRGNAQKVVFDEQALAGFDEQGVSD